MSTDTCDACGVETEVYDPEDDVILCDVCADGVA